MNIHTTTPTKGVALAVALLASLLMGALLMGCGTEPTTPTKTDAGAVDGAAHASQETRLAGLSEAGHYYVKVKLDPAKPAVATYFKLHAEVFAADMSTPATVTKAAVDGWMPMHKHGMEGITPKTMVSADKIGVIDTDGLFFIMGGQWQLRVQIQAGANGKDVALLPFYVAP